MLLPKVKSGYKGNHYITYLPFLIVSRPSRGPRTGSTVSSIFSIKTGSPTPRAFSITSKYLLKAQFHSLLSGAFSNKTGNHLVVNRLYEQGYYFVHISKLWAIFTNTTFENKNVPIFQKQAYF